MTAVTAAGQAATPGGDAGDNGRQLAWEREHEGATIGREPGSPVYTARHADGSLAASAYGGLSELIGKLGDLEDAGRCPVHHLGGQP